MAGCYHDQEEFETDVTIEVAREDDILEAGKELKRKRCKKNPGHRDFIPFKDLTLEHLPEEHRNNEAFDGIKKFGEIVVRLVVRKKVGTGFVIKIDNKYFIKTNNHVVKTENDVKHCTVEFHYDDDSRSSVITSRGVKLVYTCLYRDISYFQFHPIPEFLDQLDLQDESNSRPSIVTRYRYINHIQTTKTLVRPGPTQLMFFARHHPNSLLIDWMYLSWPDGSISYMKSCYFTFQPIPSNIQELTSIEVYIDEEDGNSRVIPGDIIKIKDEFDDEFVVKIPETIFQDEVKKCRVVWKGEVIGRGTRLYLKHVDSKELNRVLSGVDEELYKTYIHDGLWTFDFHPKPSYIKNEFFREGLDNLCCIGHPHGGIKMVTFGIFLGDSKERFDNRYRRITDPEERCQCKEVGCVQYCCKTCPGSSGSPVHLLRNGLNLISAFCHFLSIKSKAVLPNGEEIENTNLAWAFKASK